MESLSYCTTNGNHIIFDQWTVVRSKPIANTLNTFRANLRSVDVTLSLSTLPCSFINVVTHRPTEFVRQCWPIYLSTANVVCPLSRITYRRASRSQHIANYVTPDSIRLIAINWYIRDVHCAHTHSLCAYFILYFYRQGERGRVQCGASTRQIKLKRASKRKWQKQKCGKG